MTVIVIEPPSPVVSLEDAKRHLRVEHSEDDQLIAAYAAAATAWLDGPSGILGRALGPQILEWRLDEWPCQDTTFPYPPLIEVISVKYVDPGGDEQDFPVPSPFYLEDMPAVRGRSGDIRIKYRAGYDSEIPASISIAILMLVAQFWEVREASIVGSSIEEMPFGPKLLLGPFCVYR